MRGRWAVPVLISILILGLISIPAYAIFLTPVENIDASGDSILFEGTNQSDQEVDKQQVFETYGKIPMSFEANQGQTDNQVSFLSKGSGYTLFLTPNEAVFSLTKNVEQNENQVSEFAVIRMQMLDANDSPNISGADELPGKSNYFIGNDAEKWYTDIPNYKKVMYQGIYPGIDLIFYGNQRQLEFDFVVMPGADPSVIKLGFKGADKLTIDKDGNLILHINDDKVIQHAPVIYQEYNGVKENVSGKYILIDKDQVGFDVSAYNTNLSLVIDPVLIYSTYLGNSAIDQGFGIDVDSTGNVYVTGNTLSSNFPTTSPIQGTFGGGSHDAFVTKFNPAGSAHVYSTYLGGSGNDVGRGIVVDSSGNAYVTGDTGSSNFPTTNPIQGTFGGGFFDVFVTKINPAGSAHVYSTYIGGSISDRGHGIAVDSTGNAYVTGSTSSSNFPTTSPIQGYGGSTDAFVTKINPAGSAHVYSTFLGGSNVDIGFGIDVDSSGNAYVTGRVTSTNFPTTSPIQGTYGGSFADAFVTKINPAGSAHVYSTYLGGSGEDKGHGIAVDSTGNAHVTGETRSSNFPTTSPIQGTFGGGLIDAFVTKINPAGSAHVYSTYLGGNVNDRGLDIAVDPTGNAHVTGSTSSSNFPTTNPIQGFSGPTDAFVTKINTAGSAHVYSTYLGGSGSGQGRGIAVDSGNTYVTGDTTASNFPTTNPIQGTFGGLRDVFVLKIGEPSGIDADGDGFDSVASGGDDCDDGVAAINPGATEVDNGIDDDCDIVIDEGFDTDGDGFTPIFGGDCNDGVAAINPGATEVFNGLDDNCDTVIDEGFTSEEATATITDDVQALIDDDTLNKGQGNSLIKKLENIIKKFEDGENKPACNQLNAFTKHVNSLIDDGVLTSAQGQPLIDQANLVKAAFC